MQDHCSDCLSKNVCEITGGVCLKIGALFGQRKKTTNGRIIMSNTAKNSATPKTVAEAAEKNAVEETTVPAQTTAGNSVKDNPKYQAVNGKYEKSNTETTGDAQSEEKLTLVQRVKATAEKLKKNKKAMLIIGGAVVVVGLTIKNSRKTVAAEATEDDVVEETTEIANPDDTTDSI